MIFKLDKKAEKILQARKIRDLTVTMWKIASLLVELEEEKELSLKAEKRNAIKTLEKYITKISSELKNVK